MEEQAHAIGDVAFEGDGLTFDLGIDVLALGGAATRETQLLSAIRQRTHQPGSAPACTAHYRQAPPAGWRFHRPAGIRKRRFMAELGFPNAPSIAASRNRRASPSSVQALCPSFLPLPLRCSAAAKLTALTSALARPCSRLRLIIRAMALFHATISC